MNENIHEKGITLIQLLLIVFLVGIIATIALPNYMAAIRSANGASALETMRLLQSVEATYSSSIGEGNFGTTNDLFYQDFIDTQLASAISPYPTSTISKWGQVLLPKQSAHVGFKFTLTTLPSKLPLLPRYHVEAIPKIQLGPTRTGNRAFYLDETGVIRASQNATSIANKLSTPLSM